MRVWTCGEGVSLWEVHDIVIDNIDKAIHICLCHSAFLKRDLVVRLKPSFSKPHLLAHRLFNISVCYYRYDYFEIDQHYACMDL